MMMTILIRPLIRRRSGRCHRPFPCLIRLDISNSPHSLAHWLFVPLFLLLLLALLTTSALPDCLPPSVAHARPSGSEILPSVASDCTAARLPHTSVLGLLRGTKDQSSFTGQNLKDGYSAVVSRKFGAARRKLSACSSNDISISQGPDGAHGIPQFVVQIVNTCAVSRCAPSEVHVYCGWFASAPLVNPSVFRRVAFNDCLVNAGRQLKYGEILRFQYANSFMYPLRLKSAKFC